MSNKLIGVVAALGVALLAVIVIGTYHAANAEAQTSKIEYVAQTCYDQIHGIPTANFQTCGDAEDQANAEYLCNANTLTAKCWVELK